MSRFGASKFRNAQAYIPSREEWYRGELPPTASSKSTTATATSFSSEIKCNREWIVTATPAGELSWRKVGDLAGKAGTMKVGGIGDWDLSALEDGLVVIGGTDGVVSHLVSARSWATICPWLIACRILVPNHPEREQRSILRHCQRAGEHMRQHCQILSRHRQQLLFRSLMCSGRSRHIRVLRSNTCF
jgi:hypothetical protein